MRTQWIVRWVSVCCIVLFPGLHRIFALPQVTIQFEDGSGLKGDQAVLMEVANPGYTPVRWRATDQPILVGPGPTDKPLYLRDIRRLEYHPSNRRGTCALVVTLRDGASLGVGADTQPALQQRTWSKEYKGYTVSPIRLLLELRLKRDTIRIWDPFDCAFINPVDAHGDRRNISTIAFE